MMLKKHAKMLLYAIIYCTGVFIGYTFFASDTIPKRISIHYDEQLSSHAQDLIQPMIKRMLAAGKNAHTIRAAIREQIPIINYVTINRRQPHAVHVNVKAERPFLLAKQVPSGYFILSCKGNTASYQHYAAHALLSLPQIIIEDVTFSTQQQKELYHWAQQLLSDFESFFEHYSVTWLKPTKILLKDKGNPNFYIIATTQTHFTPKLQNKLETLQKQILEKRTQKKWDKKLWKADIRFKDQIVLSPIKNGKGTL